MLAVAITGILAATSVTSFSKYKRKAITAKGVSILGTIQKTNIIFFNENGYFVGGSSRVGLTPTDYNQWSRGESLPFQSAGYDSPMGISPVPQGTRTHFLFNTIAAEYDASGTMVTTGKDAASQSDPGAPMGSFDGNCLGGSMVGFAPTSLGVPASPTGTYHYFFHWRQAT